MKDDSFQTYYNFFVHFANKTKLKIIAALVDGPLSVAELAKKIDSEQSKVSHNLKKLTECNILTVEQQGKRRIYSLNKQTVLPMLSIIKNHTTTCCCEGCDKCQ